MKINGSLTIIKKCLELWACYHIVIKLAYSAACIKYVCSASGGNSVYKQIIEFSKVVLLPYIIILGSCCCHSQFWNG